MQQDLVRLGRLLMPVKLGKVLGSLLEDGKSVQALLRDGFQMLQCPLVVPLLCDEAVLVKQNLGVLNVLVRWRILQGALVHVENLLGGRKIPVQLMRHSQGSPVLEELRTRLKHGDATLHVACVITGLHLEESEIAENLRRFGINSQGLLVCADGVLVLLDRAVKQAVDVPADGALHVGHEGDLGQREGLVRLALLVHDERLHGHRVSVLRVLLENHVGVLETSLVLFVVIVAHDCTEQSRLLRGKLLRHVDEWRESARLASRGSAGAMIGAGWSRCRLCGRLGAS